ncbi:hypothetical protein RBU61_09475 [Tissierella sp. MB52-C2]|uniref:hypothetical protein n=1 Tax=Tissierella sp. MB52-C2 TaxID=3070999 RepID=UPI00280AFD18|nr:hypothetical protein [Tissierella sp. MB52-C2]WMM26881.1 hypothetical protein RBU61_09475 [Tissierella sp. MB52-C2]
MFDLNFKPIALNDIDIWTLFEKTDGNLYCIGSKTKDRFIMAQEYNKDLIYQFAKELDGSHSVEELINNSEKKYESKFDVKQLLEILGKAGLIQNANVDVIEKQELDKYSFKIYSADLSNHYNFYDKAEKVIFPYGMIFFNMLILLGIILAILNLNIFYDNSTYHVFNSYEIGLLVIMINSTVSLIFHEFGHIITGYHKGLKPKSIIISLYMWITPIVYVKTPGIYTLKPRDRIEIFSAGIFANLVLFSLFMAIFTFTKNSIFVLFALPNLYRIVTNLSPFMPLDGYLILSTIFKMPNLRKNSFKKFKKVIKEPKLLKDNKNIFILIYFILSLALILFIITSQLNWIVREIVDSIDNSVSILDFLWKMKLFVLFIGVIIIKSIYNVYIKIQDHNSNKKELQSN